MNIEVELIETLDAESIEAFCRDEPELSSRPSRLSPKALARMIALPEYQLLVARRDGDICGMLTLAVYWAPGGVKARVDDVVAEQTEGGQAVAVTLIREAVRRAVAAGAAAIHVVSKPALPVANSTFEQNGFSQEGPGIYRRSGSTPTIAAPCQRQISAPDLGQALPRDVRLGSAHAG
ncbi:GNAT family N-acetyltransferase [Micromonospora noduli]|uniref:GNAT family N-acetyltransferase n=1 Tax=Micromonospora noduli TaxID=709876 RepID=UPI0015EBFE31|nr:GNAT family N-acetyltransferase [Micromonospora noduli]